MSKHLKIFTYFSIHLYARWQTTSYALLILSIILHAGVTFAGVSVYVNSQTAPSLCPQLFPCRWDQELDCAFLCLLYEVKLRCRDEDTGLELWPDSMPKTRTQGFLIPSPVKYQLLFSLHLSFIVSSVNQARWLYHSTDC